MNQDVLAQLAPWKLKTFRSDPPEIALDTVVDSISRDQPMVHLVPNKNKDRWVAYRKDIKNQPALICYASVWLWGSPFETGNYVPDGETKSPEIPLSRVQNTPTTHLCEISYAFDMSEDRSLYEKVKILDRLAAENPSFQEACQGRPKSTFQNGESANNAHRYIMTARVFMYKTPHFKMSQLKYRLHNWVKDAVEKEPRLAPNKARPRMWDWDGSRWRKVEDTDENRFKKDEIVWYCCVLAFSIKNSFWTRDLIPVSLVRVGKLDTTSRVLYPPLDTDFDFPELGDGDGVGAGAEASDENEFPDPDEKLEDVGKKRKRLDTLPHDEPSDGEDMSNDHEMGGGSVRKVYADDAEADPDISSVESGVSNMEIDDASDIHMPEAKFVASGMVTPKKRSRKRQT